MSVYEEPLQATSKYHDPESRKIEQNGGELLSPVVSGSEKREYDWADVLKELEPYY